MPSNASDAVTAASQEKKTDDIKDILSGDGQLSEEQKQKLLEIDRETLTRQFKSRTMLQVFAVLAFGVGLYHLYTAAFGTPLTLIHRSVHVSMMLVLAFMLYPLRPKHSTKSVPWYDWLLVALSLTAPIYMLSDYLGIVERAGNPNGMDTIIATILIFLCIEASRRCSGWWLVILNVGFLVYGLWGNLLSGIFRHRGYDWQYIANHLFANTEGIYGTSVSVAASYIVLFIIFGSVISRSGLGQFFHDIALALAGHYRGGPAKVSVVGSAMMGMINGSCVANAVTVGAFTIPLMKKTGYEKDFAGAVEAASSVGGQVMPPVMGAAAFIMAEMLGMRYSEVALAAAIPAFLYYLGVLVQVHQRACKMGLTGIAKKNLPDAWAVFKARGYLILPIVLLLYMMFFSGATIIYSAFFSILATFGLHAVIQLAQTIKSKGSLKKWATGILADAYDAIVEAIRNTVSVAVCCASVGIMIGVISKTGFGLNMTAAIISLGSTSMFLTLVFTMITSIILGLGLPSIPSYIITATIAASALVELGIAELSAHFFCFYFAMLANLTPPVALAGFAAAGIAGGDPMRTSWIACKLGIAGFIVPFMFVYCQELLLINATWLSGIFMFVTAVIGVFLLTTATEGFWITKMRLLTRLIAVAGGICLIYDSLITAVIGFLAFALVWFLQQQKKKEAAS